jgi:hypothetical protein
MDDEQSLVLPMKNGWLRRADLCIVAALTPYLAETVLLEILKKVGKEVSSGDDHRPTLPWRQKAAYAAQVLAVIQRHQESRKQESVRAACQCLHVGSLYSDRIYALMMFEVLTNRTQEDYQRALSLVKTTNDGLKLAAIKALASLMDPGDKHAVFEMFGVFSEAANSLHVKMAAAKALIKLSKKPGDCELASNWCVKDYVRAATVAGWQCIQPYCTLQYQFFRFTTKTEHEEVNSAWGVCTTMHHLVPGCSIVIICGMDQCSEFADCINGLVTIMSLEQMLDEQLKLLKYQSSHFEVSDAASWVPIKTYNMP